MDNYIFEVAELSKGLAVVIVISRLMVFQISSGHFLLTANMIHLGSIMVLFNAILAYLLLWFSQLRIAKKEEEDRRKANLIRG